jgi:hypothetical protein
MLEKRVMVAHRSDIDWLREERLSIKCGAALVVEYVLDVLSE